MNCPAVSHPAVSVGDVQPNPPGPIEVRRSRKRVRTVTAYRDGDTTVVSPSRYAVTVRTRLRLRRTSKAPGGFGCT